MGQRHKTYCCLYRLAHGFYLTGTMFGKIMTKPLSGITERNIANCRAESYPRQDGRLSVAEQGAGLFPYIIFGNEVVVKGFELAQRQFFNAVLNGSYQLFAPAVLISAKMSKYLFHDYLPSDSRLVTLILMITYANIDVYCLPNRRLLPLNSRWRL